MTVNDICKQLRVHPETVRYWLRTGRLAGTMSSKKEGYTITDDDFFLFTSNHPKYEERRKEMTKESRDQGIIEVAEFWGAQMPMMAMEEMAELIQAISKFERGKPLATQAVIKEMADVYISLRSLMYMYSIDQGEIVKAIDNKLEKKY